LIKRCRRQANPSTNQFCKGSAAALDVAVFHKQWGVYRNNPLVVNKGMSIDQAKGLDKFGKGGGLIDGELVREFPNPRKTLNKNAA
jgi:hypothetical protein